MPVDLKVADGGLGSMMIGTGVVTGRELLDCINMRFSADEKTRKYVYCMSDHTDTEDFRVSKSEIELMAQRDMEAAAVKFNMIFAIVAPEDLGFGLSRTFEVHAENTGWDIRVFRAVAEARDWIRKMASGRCDRDLTFESTE